MMHWSDLSLLAAPLLAGLLVLATHVPLGIQVLRRGIIFIDLAVAQVAALGVIIAGLLGWGGEDAAWGGMAAQLAAGAAALCAAALLTFTEKRWPHIQEALIGLLFVFAAAGGILLLAGNPHGGESLRDLLTGQILWVSDTQLIPVAALYAALLIFMWRSTRRQHHHGPGGPEGFGFYALFALAVTASVQLVGVLLVFASLIAPAVATTALSGRQRHLAALLLGAAAYLTGLALSLKFDLPAGAVIVCVLVVFALLGLMRRR